MGAKRGRGKNSVSKNACAELLIAADAEVLRELVQEMMASRLDVRRACMEFLRKHVAVGPEVRAEAEAETIFALWEELEPDLSELDEYGGGYDDIQDRVGDLLYELSEKLQKSHVAREHRRVLLGEVIPYIRSGNAGMDDSLYDVAYAACRDDEDLRDLAERLERLEQDWPLDHARRIYRQLGDRGKYLALRLRKMEYGLDYHDLATFHWEQGEREKALAIAREGMKKAKGRMDELRAFLAERAKEAGDRHGYLDLQFAQVIEPLTLGSYKAFRRLCNAEEWRTYEANILAAVENAWPEERLKIRMHRNEYNLAMSTLSGMRESDIRYGSGDILKIAARLEERFPEQILAFYMGLLGRLDHNMQRKIYAQKAGVALKVRHMWLDVIKKPQKWEAFAREIKTANVRRPAFQEEFARVVPGWGDL